MGASVSICNLTAVIINVSLRHVSPLYYANQIAPGACVNFEPGRVWFTVEARIWTNGTNEYNEAQKILLPSGLGLLIPPLATGLAAAIHGLKEPRTQSTIINETFVGNFTTSTTISSQTGIIAGSMIATLPGGAITTAGAIVNMDHTPRGWSVSKHGVYMTPGRSIKITGGPPSSSVTISRDRKWQRVKIASFDELNIVIEK